MCSPIPHSISGGWLGTYYYGDGRGEPTRFEATFSSLSQQGSFGGRILDDEPLASAHVADGVQAGREIVFTKIYVGLTSAAPIHYDGTLSEDGRTVRGTWLINFQDKRGRPIKRRGTWDARRLWSEVADEESDVEVETMRRELVTIGGER